MQKFLWKNWPLSVKLVVLLNAILIVLAIGLTLRFITTLQEAYRGEFERQAQVALDTMSVAAANPILTQDISTLQGYVTGLGQQSLLDTARVVNNQGQVLADVHDPNAALRLEVDPFGQQAVASDSITYDWQSDRLAAAQAVVVGHQRLGAVVIAYSTQIIDDKLAVVRRDSLIIVFVAVLIGMTIAFLFIRDMTGPLRELTEATHQIAGGDLTRTIPAQRGVEFSGLAISFNSMTAQVRNLVGSLEERVEERTAQLRASAEVGRAAASALDADQLLLQTVNLITERFGFYYAAIFTPDPTGHWAILRQGTGEAGRLMKDSGHRLEIGGLSMVSNTIKTRKAQIAAQVGEGVTRFANPLLPDTQSEIALPLMVGERVLGVLDVQSTQANAFDEDSAATLQAMADQIAIALSNSIQFAQTQLALKRTESLYEASVTISEATEATGALQALLTHIATDADRAVLFKYGARQTSGRWAYAEVIAGWTRNSEDHIIETGTQLSQEQAPFINNVTAARPLLIHDSADPSIESGYAQMMARLNMRALVGLALNAGTVPIGVLILGYREPKPLTALDVQPLQALAGQIASVLYNQQLVAEAQVALTQLDDINRHLTQQTWRDFTRRTGHIRQIDLAPGVPKTIGTGNLPTRLTAPVMLHNEAIGMLRLEDIAPDRVWTSDNQALLEAVANELAIAIENQRLIEETERRAQREAQLNLITQRIRQATNVEGILNTAATELGQAFGSAHAHAQVGAARAARENDAEKDQP